MSTRSIIEFHIDGEPLVAVYQQSDGYPDSVGLELYDFLKDVTVVNGISFGQDGKIANGVPCLAAQFIAEFKDGVGGLYIDALGQREEYNYIVDAPFEGGDMTITVWDEGGELLFEGSVEEFGVFCKSYA